MKLLQIALLLLVLSPIACVSIPDKTPDQDKTPDVPNTTPDEHKTTPDVIRFFRSFSVAQLVGVCGNIERKSAISR